MPYQTVEIVLKNGQPLKVHTSQRVKAALAEITEQMTLYNTASP